jgi:hypothetical protein
LLQAISCGHSVACHLQDRFVSETQRRRLP